MRNLAILTLANVSIANKSAACRSSRRIFQYIFASVCFGIEKWIYAQRHMMRAAPAYYKLFVTETHVALSCASIVLGSTKAFSTIDLFH
jgi:hypothetical protein